MTDCPSTFPARPAYLVGGAAVLLSLALSACAAPKAETAGAFGVEAFAPRPHLKVSWRQHINPTEAWEYKPREYSTPLYRERTDQIYVGTDDGRVFKLRAGDGEILWSTRLDGPIHAEPTFGDGRIYVGTLAGTFYALDDASGKVEWEADAVASLESKAAFAEGRVFYTSSDGVLVAADAATGETLWNYRRSGPEYFTIKETAKPVVEKDAVYCGFADGVMAALQIDTGELIWKSDLSGGATEFIDADEDPIIAGDRLFAASYAGGVYALDKMTGEYVWTKEISSVADFVYGDQTLYVASATGRIVALDGDAGEVLWGFEFEEHDPVALTATRLYLFVSTASGPIYTLDRTTGYPLMTWDPSRGFNTPVVIGKANAFAFSNRGYMYGFDLAY